MAPRTPGWSGDQQKIVGYEDYPDWESWTQDWPGTAAADPTNVPPPIGTDWTTHFRPGDIPGAYGQYQDWAQGQGQDPLPIDRFNDLQYQQGVGPIPDAPPSDPAALASQGYGLQFDPQSTANTGWNLNYDILNPQGQPTGFDLSSTGPYAQFPWVPGGPDYTPPGPPDTPPQRPLDIEGPSIDLTTTTVPTGQELCEASGGTWNGFECVNQPSGVGSDPGEIVRPDWELPPDWLGDIAKTTEDIPFTPAPYAQQATYQAGQDPLSMLTTANLGSLLTTGGVAPTPLAGNIEQTLQDVLGARGVGGEAVSPLGQQAAGELGQILGAEGATTRTGLGQELSNTLEDILGGGGVAPTPQLGQDVTGQLEQLLATGGALPTDPQREAMEIEAARSPIDVLRRAQLAQGQAALADQGLLGSGAGREYLERLEERLAPMYTQAAQELELDRRQREQDRFAQALTLGAQQAQQEVSARDARLSSAIQQAQAMSGQEAALRQNQYLSALQQATGMSREQAERRESRLQNAMSLASGLSQEQSRNVLATAATVTARQQMLSDVAIQALDRNMAWNQFLSNYGLDRAKTLDAMQTGRLTAILPLLEMYLRAAGVAGQGYVRDE